MVVTVAVGRRDVSTSRFTTWNLKGPDRHLGGNIWQDFGILGPVFIIISSSEKNIIISSSERRVVLRSK